MRAQSGSAMGSQEDPKGQPPAQTGTVSQRWESLENRLSPQCEDACRRNAK